MNYKLIHDVGQIKRFLNIIPDLLPNEKLYGSMFARKKYRRDVIRSNDKTQLKRFLTKKEDLVNKIQKLEVELGTYKIKDFEIPNDALVVYLMPNPRDLRKAAFKGVKRLMEILENNSEGFNPVSEMLSASQQSKGTSTYTTLDLDKKDNLDSVLKYFDHPSVKYDVIETRGGFHILLNSHTLKVGMKEGYIPKNWYKEVTDLGVDNVGDMLTPIPGTYQGGFKVKFYEPSNN